MVRYDAVVFDLDGTLVDSGAGIVLAVDEALEALGFPRVPFHEIKPLIGPPIGNSIIEKIGYGDEELRMFNPLFRDIYKDKYLLNATVYPGILDLLSELNGKFIAIATNKRLDATKILLDEMGISQHCDHVEGQSTDGGVKKKEMVEKCIKASGIDKERTVMVGDTIMDAEAAEMCGIDFIGVTFGFGFKKAEDVHCGHAAEDVHTLRSMLLE